MAESIPPRMPKKPSGVRSPVRNSRSRGSTSLVSRSGAVGVGTCHDQRGYAHHIGRESRRNQLLDRLDGRDQYLAAQVSALLGGRKLIFKVHACGACFDHGLHQLECVQIAAKPGFGIRN